jgi:hypothetical protein
VTADADAAVVLAFVRAFERATVVDGKLTELWIVDALPSESDMFWSY